MKALLQSHRAGQRGTFHSQVYVLLLLSRGVGWQGREQCRHVHTRAHTHTQTYTCVRTYTHVHTCTHMCTHIHLHLSPQSLKGPSMSNRVMSHAHRFYRVNIIEGNNFIPTSRIIQECPAFRNRRKRFSRFNPQPLFSHL